MADGSIKISTKIDTQGAEQSFEQLKQTIDQFGGDAEAELRNKTDRMANDFNKLGVEAMKQVEGIQGLEWEIENLNAVIGMYNSGEINMDEGYAKAKEEVRSLNEELDSLQFKNNETSIKMKEIVINADKMASNLSKSEQPSKKVADNLGRASKNSNQMDMGVSNGMKSLGRYALALFSIRSIYGMLSKLANNWLNSTDPAANKAKAQIQAVTDMLSSALAPVISFIANTIYTLMGYLNGVLKFFFGIELSSKKAAKNTGGMAGGIKQAAKEQKKFLSGFDEIEKVTSDINDNMDGAGGGGGGSEPVVLGEPDTSKIDALMNSLKAKWDKIWQNDTVQSFFDSIYRIGKNSFDMLFSIGANVFRNWGLVFDAMLPHVQRGTAAMIEFYRLMLEDLANATDIWLPLITESFNSFIDSVFDTFRPLFEFMAQLWADTWEMVLELWQTYGQPLLDGFFEFVDNTIQIFEKIWAIIDTIITPILDLFKYWWDSTLKDTVMNVLSFVAELILFGLQIYNDFIAPIVGFLLDVLQPSFAVVFGIIGGILSGFLNVVTTIVNSIVGVFRGLISLLSAIFTGDWAAIWEGAVQLFKSIFDGIVAIAKMPVNFLIDMLNGFIRGLNTIKIPKWVPGVGGKGINIGQIPRLQRGGIVNRPTQAIIGDGGQEAVIPLENDTRALEQMASMLADMIGGSGGGDIIINVGGKTLLKILREEIERQQLSGNGVAKFAI